jgi:hypothetical protein
MESEQPEFAINVRRVGDSDSPAAVEPLGKRVSELCWPPVVGRLSVGLGPMLTYESSQAA